MRVLHWALALPIVLLAALLGSCDHIFLSCTEIGCADTVMLSLTAPSAGLPAGDYKLELTPEGETRVVCSFAQLEGPAGQPMYRGLECVPRALLTLPAQSTGCMQSAAGGAAGQSCTASTIPWPLRVPLTGRPRSIRVLLTREGSALLDQTIEPTYRAWRPNGENCEPVCHMAESELNVP